MRFGNSLYFKIFLWHEKYPCYKDFYTICSTFKQNLNTVFGILWTIEMNFSPFLGERRKYLVKLIWKVQRNTTNTGKFVMIDQTEKLWYFLWKKDKIPDLERIDMIY